MTDSDRCFVDTPLLVRSVNSSDALHDVAMRSLTTLHLRGASLCIAPQNLIEFRNVATRPTNANGLGYSIALAEEKAEEFEALFTLLEDNAAIYPAWKRLVHDAEVAGKQVHDARLAAVCLAHGVSSLLTFNLRHFARFTPHIPGFTLIDPHTL